MSPRARTSTDGRDSKRPWSLFIVFFLVVVVCDASMTFILGRIVNIETAIEVSCTTSYQALMISHMFCTTSTSPWITMKSSSLVISHPMTSTKLCSRKALLAFVLSIDPLSDLPHENPPRRTLYAHGRSHHLPPQALRQARSR